MGLREEQRELTRRKILAAVIELVGEGSVDALSVPAVADRSGVSIATIYRYFPSRGELLAQASVETHREAGEISGASRDRHELGDFATFVRAMWDRYQDEIPLLRHQIGSEAGRELRAARLEDSREYLAHHVRSFGVDPDSDEGARLISLVQLVLGSVAILELHDHQGIPVDDALDMGMWAVRALIDATLADGDGATG